MAETKHPLIVYHSRRDTTGTMVETVIKGTSHSDSENVDVRVRDAFTASADDVMWAGGLNLGTPENLGYRSGATISSMTRILSGLSVRAVQAPVLIAGESTRPD